MIHSLEQNTFLNIVYDKILIQLFNNECSPLLEISWFKFQHGFTLYAHNSPGLKNMSGLPNHKMHLSRRNTTKELSVVGHLGFTGNPDKKYQQNHGLQLE